MGFAAVVAGGAHAVMPAQIFVAAGEITLGVGVEVLVGGRERVTAVFRRDAAQLPQRILQVFGQGAEALSAQNDCGMFPATAGQAEMEEAMVEALVGNGDAQFVADGKVRQPLPADLVTLGEEDLAQIDAAFPMVEGPLASV